MRKGFMTLSAALLLASTHVAFGQTPAPQQATAPGSTPFSLGSIEFGFRPTSATGDAARYERYRDLRDAAYSRFRLGKETGAYLFDLRAHDVGYLDQGYSAAYASSKFDVNFRWDSIPLNYSYMSATPFVESSAGVFTIDPALRLAVQNRQVVGILCAPGAAAGATCNNPTTAGTALATPSVYRSVADTFDLKQRRDTASFALKYTATRDLGINVAVTTARKTGHQPWGASFAFNNAVELPLPLDNRTNDVSVGLEWTNRKGMLRVGWDGSWFNNAINEVVWDNPIRATDFNNGLAEPLGPYDPSGYSNGNGPAQGRLATAPSNSLNTISATALYKLPSRTTINGTLSLTDSRQNDALIPWTINQVIGANVFHMDRSTAEAEVRGYNALLNFNTRPNKVLAISARYRYNQRDSRTPHFNGEEYVRFDAVPEETGGETEQFDITRNTFDVNAAFSAVPYTTFRVGYGHEGVDRTGRVFASMDDNTVRFSVDTVGNQYLSLRGIYEYTQRRGSGLSEEALEHGGSQLGARFYDEAERNRNRGTLVLTVTPVEMLNLTASVASGRDDYNGHEHEFGLLDSKTTAVNVGFDVTPTDTVSLGATFGRDFYKSLQQSRTANPFSGVPGAYESWIDPNRNWTLTNDETVNNVGVYLDLIKAIRKTDVHVAYDFSDSDNAFIHGGPRIDAMLTNAILTPGDARPCAAGLTSCFEALPTVTNAWHRLSTDVRYFVTNNVGIGLGWWYEKLNISDYNTLNLAGTDAPRIDYLGGLLLGYGNRPYKANTGFVRLIYLF